MPIKGGETMQKTEIPAAEHILVCLSSSPSNERIVRTAGRMASVFGGSFTALYVQTPENTAMREDDQLRLQENTRLAQQLGAEIVTMRGEDVPTQIAEYARLSGVTRIVIGRSGAQRRSFWSSPTLTERLIELAPGLDIHIIPDVDVYKNYHQKKPTLMRPAMPTLRELLLTLGILTAATAIGWLFLRLGFTDANIITLYLLGVLFTSVLTSGYTCGILASILSVILFNYFLTEPHLSLLAYGSGYPVTFVIMLGASILTGTLAAKLKAHAQLSAHDAFRTKLLFDTNQQLQKAQSEEDAYQTTAVQLQRLLERDILVYPAENGQLGTGLFYAADGSPACSVPPAQQEREVVEWTWQNRKRAGATTAQFPRAKYLYLAIRTQQQAYGVIGISIAGKPLDAFESSITLSILGECALALDNLRNAREKEEAAVLAKNEQLRANLLRSISHDLRTPLTSISGNADTLLHSYNVLDEQTRKQIFTDIYDDAQWLTGLVENLLSVTKIADGSVKLRLSYQVVDDIVSEALRHIDRRSAEHHITVDCGDEPLLVRVDAGLIVQVLINLVNNAVKYTPAGSNIRITAIPRENMAEICVSDNGPGIPDELKERVFEMFFTGGNPIGDSRRSLGLGLTLCQAIIHAHNGEMTLKENSPHGCIFSFTVPLSEVNLNE
jgi:two-component system sensor histidine kinase KdpD